MYETFSLTQFKLLYPTEQSCLEEIMLQKYPEGIICRRCRKITRHYKLKRKNAYACKACRTQFSPLSGTLFEKSSTPLRQWFLAMFFMTQTRDGISSKQLQRELGVTYKTAWRIHNSIRSLMEQNNGNLLKDTLSKPYNERRWVFFNKLEFKVVQKQEPSHSKEDQEDFSLT